MEKANVKVAPTFEWFMAVVFKTFWAIVAVVFMHAVVFGTGAFIVMQALNK